MLQSNQTAGETAAITIFENAQFGQVRTAGDAINPLFCLTDVCRALSLTNLTEVKKRLKGDGLSSTEVIDTIGRRQQVTFINEQNLYRLIMRSDKPAAETFQDWVFGEVLPSIRKTGSYSVSQHGEYVVIPEHVKKQWLARAEESAYQRFRLEGCKEMVVAIHGVQPVVFEGGLWYNYAEAVRALGGKKADSSKRKRKYPQHFKLIYGRNFITAAFFNLLEKYYRYKQSELDFGKTVAEPAEATVMGIPASSMEEKKEKGGAL